MSQDSRRPQAFYSETPDKPEPPKTPAPAAHGMIAFDIETTGLDASSCRVTAACVFGPGVEETFIFKGEDPTADAALRDRFVSILDSAPRLCAFNGIRFDIPFLYKAWGLSLDRVECWVLKTFDVFEACKLASNATFSLNRLLASNGLESKSGTGCHAITLAQTKQWDALGAYCMQDTRLTYQVSCQRLIALPLTARKGARRVVLDRDSEGLFGVW